MDQEYHYLFKFILAGNVGVGKSCLLLKYTENKFRDEHDFTVGVEFGSKIIVNNKKKVKLQIWDTSGQDAFKQITKSYFKGSIGVFFVFDITNQDSFQDILKWYNDLKITLNQNTQLVLVGNKLDLESDRKISTQQAQEFADQYKMQYIEVSAKIDYNINQLFENSVSDIINKIEMKQIEAIQENGIKLGKCQQQEDTQ